MKLKSINEFLAEKASIVTGVDKGDWSSSYPEISKLGKAFGEEVGVFGLKDNKERFMYLNPADKENIIKMSDAKVKPNEYIVRFITLNTANGSGEAPLVKVNPSKGLVYFLKDYDTDIEDYEFEGKGEKVNWIRTSLK